MDRNIIEIYEPEKKANQTIIEPVTARTIIEDFNVVDNESKNSLTHGELIGGCRLDEPLQVTSGEADLWIGTRLSDNRKIVAKIYRFGMHPKVDVQEKVSRVGIEHVVQVLGRGQCGGSHPRDYELMEYIEHGTLMKWAHNGMSDAELKDILRELADAITALHTENIIHRDIKPDNVLVRSKSPLDLVLMDFGISSVAALSLHQTSINRTAAYASPESLTGVIGKPSDWWSLGVIMLEILDKNPFAGIDERSINFALSVRGISVPKTVSEEWQQVIRGLLTRDYEKRWGAEQISSWLKGRRDIPVHYEESQTAAATEAKRPYTLSGKEYRTLADLGTGVVENWSEAVKHLARGMLSDWVKSDVGDQNIANQLMDIVEDTTLTGEMKVALTGMILNRDVPITWKGEIVKLEWMVEHYDFAVKILKSSMPEWVVRLRHETWLIELRAWRNKVLSHIKQSGVSCNQGLVEQMIMSKAETVNALAIEMLESYVASSNTVLNALFSQSSPLVENNILLVACDRSLLVTKAQMQVWERETREIKELAQKLNINLDDNLLTHVVSLDDYSLQEAVASLRSQYVSASVEELRNILANNVLIDHRKARLLIACDRTLFLTKEQWQKNELEKKKLEVRELSQKLKVSIDDTLLENAVSLDDYSLRGAVSSLRRDFESSSVNKLRNILKNMNISDQEARLLISSDRRLLLTAIQVQFNTNVSNKRFIFICGVLNAIVLMAWIVYYPRGESLSFFQVLQIVIAGCLSYPLGREIGLSLSTGGVLYVIIGAVIGCAIAGIIGMYFGVHICSFAYNFYERRT